MTDLYFLHGMESSPQGTKAQLLKARYPHCIIPKLPPDIAERESILNRLITRPGYLIGSSLGGLSAILFAMQKPGLVKEMILLAPAVGFYDQGFFSEEDQALIHTTVIPQQIRCTIFAGLHDQVIPLEAIRALISRSAGHQQIVYREVDDDHSLNRDPELLLNCVQKMVDQGSPT